MVSPITNLPKNDNKWDWSMQCQMTFEGLKEVISTKLVLRLPNLDLYLRSPNRCLRQGLGQGPGVGRHLMTFEIRKLNDAEQQYSTHEKEMTVVVHYLQQRRHYLLGSIFTIVTNNMVNTFFKTQKKLSPKQAQW